MSDYTQQLQAMEPTKEYLVAIDSDGCEVLKEWRTLDLPIMPPDSVSFHAFPHKLPGLHSPVMHAYVYDCKTPQCN